MAHDNVYTTPEVIANNPVIRNLDNQLAVYTNGLHRLQREVVSHKKRTNRDDVIHGMSSNSHWLHGVKHQKAAATHEAEATRVISQANAYRENARQLLQSAQTEQRITEEVNKQKEALKKVGNDAAAKAVIEETIKELEAYRNNTLRALEEFMDEQVVRGMTGSDIKRATDENIGFGWSKKEKGEMNEGEILADDDTLKKEIKYEYKIVRRLRRSDRVEVAVTKEVDKDGNVSHKYGIALNKILHVAPLRARIIHKVRGYNDLKEMFVVVRDTMKANKELQFSIDEELISGQHKINVQEQCKLLGHFLTYESEISQKNLKQIGNEKIPVDAHVGFIDDEIERLLNTPNLSFADKESIAALDIRNSQLKLSKATLLKAQYKQKDALGVKTGDQYHVAVAATNMAEAAQEQAKAARNLVAITLEEARRLSKFDTISDSATALRLLIDTRSDAQEAYDRAFETAQEVETKLTASPIKDYPDGNPLKVELQNKLNELNEALEEASLALVEVDGEVTQLSTVLSVPEQGMVWNALDHARNPATAFEQEIVAGDLKAMENIADILVNGPPSLTLAQAFENLKTNIFTAINTAKTLQSAAVDIAIAGARARAEEAKKVAVFIDGTIKAIVGTGVAPADWNAAQNAYGADFVDAMIEILADNLQNTDTSMSREDALNFARNFSGGDFEGKLVNAIKANPIAALAAFQRFINPTAKEEIAKILIKARHPHLADTSAEYATTLEAIKAELQNPDTRDKAINEAIAANAIDVFKALNPNITATIPNSDFRDVLFDILISKQPKNAGESDTDYETRVKGPLRVRTNSTNLDSVISDALTINKTATQQAIAATSPVAVLTKAMNANKILASVTATKRTQSAKTLQRATIVVPKGADKVDLKKSKKKLAEATSMAASDDMIEIAKKITENETAKKLVAGDYAGAAIAMKRDHNAGAVNLVRQDRANIAALVDNEVTSEFADVARKDAAQLENIVKARPAIFADTVRQNATQFENIMKARPSFFAAISKANLDALAQSNPGLFVELFRQLAPENPVMLVDLVKSDTELMEILANFIAVNEVDLNANQFVFAMNDARANVLSDPVAALTTFYAAQKTNVVIRHNPIFDGPRDLYLPGLDFASVTGNGDCFYEAIAKAMGDGRDQSAFRNLAADQLASKKAEYIRDGKITVSGGIVVKRGSPLAVATMPFDDYVASVRRNTEYSDDYAITALMIKLDQPIYVIDPEGKICNDPGALGLTGEPLFVLYNGTNHYESLTVQSDEDAKTIVEKIKQFTLFNKKVAEKIQDPAANAQIQTVIQNNQPVRDALVAKAGALIDAEIAAGNPLRDGEVVTRFMVEGVKNSADHNGVNTAMTNAAADPGGDVVRDCFVTAITEYNNVATNSTTLNGLLVNAATGSDGGVVRGHITGALLNPANTGVANTAILAHPHFDTTLETLVSANPSAAFAAIPGMGSFEAAMAEIDKHPTVKTVRDKAVKNNAAVLVAEQNYTTARLTAENTIIAEDANVQAILTELIAKYDDVKRFLHDSIPSLSTVKREDFRNLPRSVGAAMGTMSTTDDMYRDKIAETLKGADANKRVQALFKFLENPAFPERDKERLREEVAKVKREVVPDEIQEDKDVKTAKNSLELARKTAGASNAELANARTEVITQIYDNHTKIKLLVQHLTTNQGNLVVKGEDQQLTISADGGKTQTVVTITPEDMRKAIAQTALNFEREMRTALDANVDIIAHTKTCVKAVAVQEARSAWAARSLSNVWHKLFGVKTSPPPDELRDENIALLEGLKHVDDDLLKRAKAFDAKLKTDFSAFVGDSAVKDAEKSKTDAAENLKTLSASLATERDKAKDRIIKNKASSLAYYIPSVEDIKKGVPGTGAVDDIQKARALDFIDLVNADSGVQHEYTKRNAGVVHPGDVNLDKAIKDAIARIRQEQSSPEIDKARKAEREKLAKDDLDKNTALTTKKQKETYYAERLAYYANDPAGKAKVEGGADVESAVNAGLDRMLDGQPKSLAAWENEVNKDKDVSTMSAAVATAKVAAEKAEKEYADISSTHSGVLDSIKIMRGAIKEADKQPEVAAKLITELHEVKTANANATLST